MNTITLFADGTEVGSYSYDPTHTIDTLTAERDARTEARKQIAAGRTVETCLEDEADNRTLEPVID